MAKAHKPSTLGIILSAVAGVGFVLAIVGLAIDAISAGASGLSMGIGLFDLKNTGTSIPGELVPAFGTISFILAFVSCLLVVLSAVGIVKLPKIVKIVLSTLVAVCAVLTVVFAIVLVGQLNSLFGEGVSLYKIAAGPFLLAIGAIAATAPLNFLKD